MTPERWQQIKLALNDALALEPAERDSLLLRLEASDSDLASEVASLLHAHEAQSPLLDTDFGGIAIIMWT